MSGSRSSRRRREGAPLEAPPPPTGAASRRPRRQPSTAEPTEYTVCPHSGVHRFSYANGLQLLVGERHAAPIVSSMIWYRSGSAAEPAGKTGVAHFLEHLLFKGTRRRPKGQVDALTQQLGGRNNAFTGRDYTAFFFQFAADRWTCALDIEADRMTGCTFAAAEVEAERRVVLDELRRDLDSPCGQLDREMLAAAYRYHPYRHPILGWQADIEGLRVADVRAYYRAHYHPGNAVAVVCGAVDAGDVARQVGERFRRLRARAAPPALPRPEPPQAGERRVTVEGDLHVPRLQVAYHAAPLASPDFHALEVVETLLAAGKSSRLNRRLVDRARPLMLFADAGYDAMREDGLFWIYGDVSPDVPVARVERELYRELDRLATRGPSAAELTQAHNQIATSFVFRVERVLQWAEDVGRFAVLGTPSDFGRYLDRIAAVTADDVRRVVCRYLTRRNRTVGLALPHGHAR